MADTLKIVGSTLLGLTVGCAQCHDHRYDPIPQADYYRLRAVFEPALDPSHWRRPAQRLVSLFTDADRAKCSGHRGRGREASEGRSTPRPRRTWTRRLEKELAKFPETIRGKLRDALQYARRQRDRTSRSGCWQSNPSVNITAGVLYQYDPAAADDLKKEQAKVAAKRAEKPVEDFVSVLDEVPGVVPETKIFHRGDHRQPTKPVGPGDLTIAAPEGARFEIPEKDAGAAHLGPHGSPMLDTS